MIDRLIITADTEWSVGMVGASIRAAITCEAIRSDARKGSETDGVAVNLPIKLAAHFHPPPIGRAAEIIASGETLVSGIITSVVMTQKEIRLQIDL